MAPGLTPSVPTLWRQGDVVRLACLLGIGGAVLAAASLGSGGTTRTSDQMAWLALGVGSVTMCGAGVAAWVLVGRRRISRRRSVVLPDPTHLDLEMPSLLMEQRRSVDEGVLVALDRGNRYHWAWCPAVATKRTHTTEATAGRTACGICRPDEPDGGAGR